MNAVAKQDSGLRICALICAYQEGERIGEVVKGAQKYCSAVVVVDDGSDDNTAKSAEDAGAQVLRHEKNLGKGTSLRYGFEYLLKGTYDAVITLDGDGQHDPEEIPHFVETYKRTHIPVLIGNRMSNPVGMSLIRRWTTHLMCRQLEKLTSHYIPDPPCGYRFYRCNILPHILSEEPRFGAEYEMLVNIAGKQIRTGSIRIRSIYRGQHSCIRPLRDSRSFLILVHRRQKEINAKQRRQKMLGS